MNEVLLRRREKMRVLLRLRELERDGALAVLQEARHEERLAQQRRVDCGRRYEVAVESAPSRLAPEAHGWRLAAIEQLRQAADAAGHQLQRRGEAAAVALRHLTRCRLETRVAERAAAAAATEWRHESERDQQAESLDLQLVARWEGI